MMTSSKIIPLVLEPISFESVGILQQVNQLESLTDEGSLERVKDALLQLFPTTLRGDRWNTKKRDFLKKVSEYLIRVSKTNVDESEAEGNERLLRGGFTDFVVDSSLTHNQSLNNIDLNNRLIYELQHNNSKSVDLKFNYLGSLCASNWLELSTDPSYGHSKLIELIRNSLDEIISTLNLTSETRMDLVSLGPGDGEIDKFIIHSFKEKCKLINYYPLDLSFELLQKATLKIIQTRWLKGVNIKAIHGDFTELINYKPIYGYDRNVNFLSLVGFTFGDFNEGELLGKIKEGMNDGDYLLLDARLHELSTTNKLTQDDKQYFFSHYKTISNNRFAFGPLETVTVADFSSVKFDFDIKTDITVVPGAVNVVTYCRDINTKFRFDGRALKKSKINLTSTTFYKFEELESWLLQRNLQICWKKKIGSIGLFLLRK